MKLLIEGCWEQYHSFENFWRKSKSSSTKEKFHSSKNKTSLGYPRETKGVTYDNNTGMSLWTQCRNVAGSQDWISTWKVIRTQMIFTFCLLSLQICLNLIPNSKSMEKHPVLIKLPTENQDLAVIFPAEFN